jgi:Cu/Ag efflux protein CusF
MRLTIGVGFTLLLFLVDPIAQAQQSEKKWYVLRGTVAEVNRSGKRLSVTNEPIPGGMGAMTMNYSVDQQDVLGRVKAGDHITAKMYEGDMTLFDIQVVVSTPAVSQVVIATALGLEDFERMALAGNPTIAQVEANVRIAAGQASRSVSQSHGRLLR